MTIWLDAQLSPRIARWLAETFSVTAIPVRDAGFRDAEDEEIFLAQQVHTYLRMRCNHTPA